MESRFNKLEEIDRTKNPFKVPENYFAQFNEEIMNRLPEREIVPQRTVTLWDKVKPWVYMAAMFIGLFFIVQFLSNQKSDNNIASRQALVQSPSKAENSWSAEQVSEEEFYQYLEQQLVDESYFDYMYDQYYLN